MQSVSLSMLASNLFVVVGVFRSDIVDLVGYRVTFPKSG